MDKPSVKDLDIVLMGGYPPEYIVGGGAATNLLATCPNGIWRVVLTACAYGNNSAFPAIRVQRQGIYYDVAVAISPIGALERGGCQLNRPLVLRPGDSIHCSDISAAAAGVVAWISYVDIPIPSGGQGEFKRVRRG